MWFLINAYFHVGAIMYSIYIYLLFIIATLPRINSFEEIDTYLSYFAIYKDRMIPHKDYQVQSFQTTTAKQCAELCLSEFHNTNLRCRSFEMVGGRLCALSNTSAGVSSKYGYQNSVRAPGTTYYEASKEQLAIFTRFPGFVFRNDSKYTKLINNTEAEDCAHACIMAPQFNCNSFAYNHGNRICALSGDVVESPDDILRVGTYDTFQYSGDWPCDVTLPWNYNPRVIASPRYPFISRSNQTCRFHLLAPPTKTVVLKIGTIFIKGSVCSENESGLFIYDGETDQSQLLLRVCRHRPELMSSSFKSTNRSLTITIRVSSVVMKMTYDFADHDICDGHHCQNGGSCVPQNQKYACACVRGFSGRRCETNIDDCENNPCMFGKCVDKVAGYECECLQNAFGKRCETYMGDCVNEPCVNGTCKPLVSGYKCSCTLGYTGRNCEYEINECFSNPCVHGRCIDTVNNYNCICDQGFVGWNCQVRANTTTCKEYDCKFGTCAVNESGSFCQCFPGYSGMKCEINVNECEPSPCGPYGRCVDHSNGYHCECVPGFVGAHCNISLADSCHKNSCIHGYCSVISPDITYRCICQHNFTGRACDTIVSPCDSNPCLHGTCLNRESDFECKCNLGYRGKRCDIKDNGCDKIVCFHGECVNIVGNYTCKCSPGWTGYSCDVQVSLCTTVDCNKGTCRETTAGVICVCDSGHSGKYCEIEINPCRNSPCGENETCSPNQNTFSCNCGPGRTGQLCDKMLNPCHLSPCIHGTCFTHQKSYICVCDASYTGSECQFAITTATTTITTTTTTTSQTIQTYSGTESVLSSKVTFDPCKQLRCVHGICISVNDGVFCSCDKQFTGKECNSPIGPDFFTIFNTTEFPNTNNSRRSNLCANSPCINGSCHVINSKPVCSCYDSYTGLLCDVLIVGNTSKTIQKYPNDSNFCGNKTCVNGYCVTHNNKSLCLCDQNHTGDPCQLIDNVSNTHIEPESNNHHKSNTDQNHTKETDGSRAEIKCNTLNCVNGECLYKTKREKCRCYQGFTGKSCNISLKAVDVGPSNHIENVDSSMQYVAIGVLSACLLLVVVACGVLWFRKRQSGSVYITNPSDFEASGPVKKQSARQTDRDINNRCAFQLGCGASESSDDSRNGNKYDDVNINGQRQFQHSYVKPVYTNQDRIRIPPTKRSDSAEGETPDKIQQHNNKDVSGAVRQIFMRLYDKRYSNHPKVQTLDGVERGKSEA